MSELTHRLDVELVARSLARSRGQARDLVKAGAVLVDGSPATKISTPVRAVQSLELVSGVEGWVSRAACKLVAALETFGLEGPHGHHGLRVDGKRCFDVGACTGGFTQVLLREGAREVVALDVGHGQLAEKLRGDARITALEGINARHLDAASLPVPRFDLIVGDLSFISLSLVLPALAPLLGGTLLMLVKPQFELQPADIGKGGLVKDPAAYARVEARLREACAALRLNVVDWFDSPIAGGDGNREFFLQAHHE